MRFRSIPTALLVGSLLLNVAPLELLAADHSPGLGFALDNGDANGDLRRDLSDVSFLLRHLFLGSRAPVPLIGCGGYEPSLLNGDSNGDGACGVGDAIQLVSWLHGDGPPPTAACEKRTSLGASARAGVYGPAVVLRDNDGIAHIRATNDHDLFLLNGYVHAEDRLFQIDLLRRQGSGTLAELVGPGGLGSDASLRPLGLRRSAAASLEALSGEARAALEAYSEGVNAWVADHPLPPEYAALELSSFEPWTPLDSVVVSKLILLNLSLDLGDIDRTVALASYQATGQAAGFDGAALFFEDLFRSEPFDPASTVPDATETAGGENVGAYAAPARGRPAGKGRRGGAAPEKGISPEAVALARRYLDRIESIPVLQQPLGREDAGSNEWAVTGALTESGRPLLAHDPHLALGTPSTLYPIHLRSPSFDVAGSELPGLPALVLGHNRWISWAGTVNLMDMSDVFQEEVVADPSAPSGLSTVYQGELEPVIAVPEQYRVNQPQSGVQDDVQVVPPEAGLPPASLIVPRRNGPIISLDLGSGVALSLQYAGFYPTREVDMFLQVHRARNLEQFREALQFFDGGSQNWGYADVEGNIAYFTSGELPIREDLQAGNVAGLPPYFIRNGTGGNEWLSVENPQPHQALSVEILPFDEMPQLVNPPTGWFVNGNNDAAGNTLDNDPLNQLRSGGGLFYFNHGFYARGFRAGRITQLVRAEISEGDGKFSVADMQRIQSDVVLLDAQVLVPYIQQAFQNASRDDAGPQLAALAENPAVSEAVGRLSAWDFSTPTGIPEGYDAADENGVLAEPGEGEVERSVAATIYSVWRGQILRQTIDATLAPFSLPRPNDSTAMVALRHLLESFEERAGVGVSGLDFFSVPGVESAADRRDIVILRSLSSALELLAGEPFAPAFGGSADQDDYRWGRLHRIVFAHPLGGPFSIPPAGGAFPQPLENLPGIPTDGGWSTVDASRHGGRADSANGFMFSGGPAGRFVYDPHPSGVRAVAIWPGGASGVVGSPFFANLLPFWLTNETLPLRVEMREILHALHGVDLFLPGAAGRR